MNYKEMSDFEINKAVAIKLGYDCPSQKPFPHTGGNGVHRHRKGNPMRDCRDVNYCNSWDDAGDIIESGISIINIKGSTQWFACVDVEFDTICMSPDGSDNGVSCFNARLEEYSTNPLRAAMIVFLMMEDNIALAK